MPIFTNTEWSCDYLILPFQTQTDRWTKKDKKKHKYNLAKDRCVTFIYQTFFGGKGLDRIVTHSFAHSFLFAVKLDIFLPLFLQLSLCKTWPCLLWLVSQPPSWCGNYKLICNTEKIWAKVMSLGSHNWKLSVHRQDSGHSITSAHLEKVKWGWLAWDYLEKPCAGKYYTHQQSSLSDELTLSNLVFTLPVKISSIQVHKAPMTGNMPSALLPSDSFLFQNSHCMVQFTPRHACQACLTWALVSMCKIVHMDDCRAAVVVSGCE